MIETVFRTAGLPASERFECWRETMQKLTAPSELTSDHAADFQADMRFLRIGDVLVWPATVLPARFRRTPRLIRQSDPDTYHLTCLLRGTKDLSHAGREERCGAYDLQIADHSRPYDARVVDTGTTAQAIGVEVPKSLLPLPRRSIDVLIARRLSARDGLGGLLTGFLNQLVQDTGSYGPGDGPRLETVLVDLVTALLAHELDAQDALHPEARQRALTLRIQAFIGRHLADCDLTPGAIAAAHHISVSYLHRLFRQQGTSVSSLIRRQRLERARRDLADPAQRATPVHAIAARWAFPQHATFSRAFHATYGLAPRDYRQRALSKGA
jgi:AraC-like DNA-binding protein